jgi:D-xylose transport system substrate-binding protein
MRRRRSYGLLAATAAATLVLAACGGDDSGGTTTEGGEEGGAAQAGRVGVILPETATSARWETADRPLLQQAFEEAGVEADIQNAQGDRARFQTIADGMIASGVSVLIITNVDNESGAAVIQKANDVGIPVIDYDRLTLGGGASYYVSFDNVEVGRRIGEGLLTCLQNNGTTTGGVVLLNGAPTDNNATLFKQGYEEVLTGGGYTVAADQAVPEWNNTQAGTIFEQIFTQQQGQFVAVAAANDGLGGAVVSVLERNGLAGQIPVSGQDATDEGLQRVLLGTQCNTVYKAVSKEATAAADLAVALAQGDQDAANAIATGTVTDTETNEEVPSVLLEPQGILAENVKDVIADGYTTKEKICTTPELQAACTANGIT